MGAHITTVTSLPAGIARLSFPLERVAAHDGGAVAYPERHSVSSEEDLHNVGVADTFGLQDVVGDVVLCEAGHDGRVVVTGRHLEESANDRRARRGDVVCQWIDDGIPFKLGHFEVLLGAALRRSADYEEI